uniref:Polyprotein P2a n=1 Tax=Cocksfoot mottle virus TaxID=40979 RepID=A0A2H4ZK50_9VIRU|nr:polyprotein P2a [Cocksfoot mottle virus]
MGCSVVGNCKSVMLMSRMSWSKLALLISVAMAAAMTDSPPTLICMGILVSVVLNWIVCAVCEEASELILGVTLEATRPSPARVIGEPVFDPRYGYVAPAIYDGKSFDVILPISALSAASTRKETVEMAVENSRLQPLESSQTPKSLVALYSHDLLSGWGSRIRGLDGQEYLLTALHVWETNITHLCKDGKKVPISGCPVVASSADSDLDFVLVSVPKNAWSVLGVGVARLELLKRRTVVTVYGGLDSKTTYCATGVAELENPFRIVTKVTTTGGWSGSPLYHKDAIVGLHLGARPSAGVNRACNVAMAFRVVRKFVTVENSELYPDQSSGPARELDAETYTERLEQGIAFTEYDINGIKVKTSDREWTTAEALRIARYKPLSGGKAWGDSDDEDTQETAIRPLNCQRAGSLRDSPPLANLSSTRVTSGVTKESLIPTACHSDPLESRVAGLEKLCAERFTEMFELLRQSSLSSKNSPGQAADQKQKSDRSSSKPAGLRESKRPPICNWQSLTSKPSTRSPDPAPASAESHGVAKTSSQKSKRSRTRGKSTSKQVLASPSPKSGSATSK